MIACDARNGDEDELFVVFCRQNPKNSFGSRRYQNIPFSNPFSRENVLHLKRLPNLDGKL